MAESVALNDLLHALAEERNLDLRGYKNSTLERRVRRRMFQLNLGSFAEYLETIRRDPDEKNELLNTVLINVTEFFRDPQAWDVIRRDVLPRIFSQLRPGDTFRAWSAGCASGEEPYSLAILVSEHFASNLQECEVKIYATDIDEEALNAARRGEYPASRLRRMDPEWRDKYFQGTTVLRINRDIRRMVIFGRSNMLSDAPISHCHLVICRNVLIYFDAETQKNVFARLHYALDPNGILFLGKAESKLTESHLFRPLHSRWRIFQRVPKDGHDNRDPYNRHSEEMMMPDEDKTTNELRLTKLHQRLLLETIKSGVILLDANDAVFNHNDAALNIWGVPGLRIVGKRVQNTELVFRCPELSAKLEESRGVKPDLLTFSCRARHNGEERLLSIAIRPVISDKSERVGTIVYIEDDSSREKLQTTIEQLEATGEELQSANEELETTNEELQSTNEELETTNEELQSTNEELETTNEELQSLNEELEKMNDQLETRTRELDALTSSYAETLRRMPWPVLLVDKTEKIQIWNSAAQRLFGVGATSVVGVDLDRMPLDATLRKSLLRKCRAVLTTKKAGTIKGQELKVGNNSESFDLHFTPISRDDARIDGVLIMFGPLEGALRSGNSRAEPRKTDDHATRKKSNHRKSRG